MKSMRLLHLRLSAVAIILLVSASACYAEAGSADTTFYFSAHIEPLKAGTDVVHANFTVHGVMVTASGEGPFHNSTVSCQGGLLALKGEYDYDGELCVIQLANGDQIFGRWSSAGQLGKSGRTRMKLIGGTGAWAGMSGDGESERVVLRGAVPGISGGYEKGTIRWSRP